MMCYRSSRSRWMVRRPPRRPRGAAPALEALEDRWLPSGTYVQTNLVSDIPGLAQVTDANLVNPWGITASPLGPFWVSDNGTGVSTLYNGSGQPQSLVVTIPPPAGSPAGTTAAPTGIIFNGTNAFQVSAGGKSGPAVFIFVTEDGTISGWSPGVDPTNAVLAVDNSAGGAVYKGATTGLSGSNTFLYVANFHAGTIEVYDSTFKPATLSGSFADPTIPAGFAPFDIQNINGDLYVTYAKQDADQHDDVAGPGNGFVNVFDTNGNLLRRLVSNGPLNSPWGLALAPASFGEFGGDLLVGNFGDGHISAFDPASGKFQGQLTGGDGQPVVIDGLWGLRFGNGVGAGPAGTLFFTAGLNGEADGLFGKLAPSPVFATGTDLGGGPQVNVIDAASGGVLRSFMAYDEHFLGGVRVATGDVNGDGVPDIVTAPGPTGGPDIRVFDGVTGKMIQEIQAFSPGFLGGETVAVGNFDADGKADIVVGADAGGGPEVRVFSGADGHAITSFFAYDPAFMGGVRVAVGDVNGDGHDDVVTGAGAGGGPHVKVFDGTNFANTLQSFFAYTPAFTGGVNVAAGDVNGDGKADVITGAGMGGGPHVEVFSGANGSVLQSFFAYASGFAGGVRVGSIADANGDGKAEVVTAPGISGGPEVKVFDNGGPTTLDDFYAYSSAFMSGVFVGGS